MSGWCMRMEIVTAAGFTPMKAGSMWYAMSTQMGLLQHHFIKF